MSADVKHPSTMNQQSESTIRSVEFPPRWKLRLKREPFTPAQLAFPKRRVAGTIHLLANRSHHQRYVLETGNQKILIYSGPKPGISHVYNCAALPCEGDAIPLVSSPPVCPSTFS